MTNKGAGQIDQSKRRKRKNEKATLFVSGSGSGYGTYSVRRFTEPGTYVIKAKPDDGWKFVKWIKDGEDFSEETDITVEVTEDVEYIAVFDAE